MINPNLMSLDECRDWLARDDGWTNNTRSDYNSWEHTDGRSIGAFAGPGDEDDHPYQATLDAAAAAMPEGWDWQRGDFDGYPDHWRAWHPKRSGFIYVPDTSPSGYSLKSETVDRFRLAVACRMAMKGNVQLPRNVAVAPNENDDLEDYDEIETTEGGT